MRDIILYHDIIFEVFFMFKFGSRKVRALTASALSALCCSPAIVRNAQCVTPDGIMFIHSEICDMVRKYCIDNPNNSYSIIKSGYRQFSSSSNVLNRLMQSYKVCNDAHSTHNIVCWDVSLALLWEASKSNRIYQYLTLRDTLRYGLGSHEIPFTIKQANHTFCYFYVGGYLILVDPLFGIVSLPIHYNDVDFESEVREFYDKTSYPNLHKRFDGVKKVSAYVYGFVNDGLNKIKGNAYQREHLSNERIFFSENIACDYEKEVSDIRWTQDMRFFNGIKFGGGNFPSDDTFTCGAPGLLFGRTFNK